jgi:hypothetical protein
VSDGAPSASRRGREAGDSGDPGPRGSALAWLEERLDDVEPELATAVLRCVREAAQPRTGTPVADVLADAAVAELTELAAGPQDRASARRLLAADAVLTYAFEAAAEEGGDPAELAERIGPRGVLGRALADVSRPERPEAVT